MANPSPTHQPFRPIELSLRAIRALRPAVLKIRKHDRNLADQLRRSLTAVPANLGEGQYRTAGNRRLAYRTAAGEASEPRLHCLTALAWGYVDEREVTDGIEHLDHILAILWKCR
jgi:four helix bundle protein